ncbi:MAG: metallophosphoesterase family protein [Chthoniobacterales bacterium]
MSPSKTLRIFVLADTHNHLPENVQTLATDADEIWHLGDVCSLAIFTALKRFGPPMSLVRGNCDSNFAWPLTLDLTRQGVRFRLVHIPPTRPPENVDVLLHGHTHVPCNELHGGVRFLNPGCVTRPNRGAPASAAILEVDPEGRLDWQLLPLR